MKMLIYGYGNPGRLDDGLGPAFAERMQALDLAGVMVESNYQLNIEDADTISSYDCVVFVDASVDAAPPFSFEPLERREAMVGFSSHSITAESLLGLADQLFSATPEAYMLGIRGYEFNDFGERLSNQALLNLRESVRFLSDWIGRQKKNI